ncbi:hypothetical protein LTR66_017611 [Elasticomyces elasticus]|nr:hypothetical protein LTR66_017611 [Elasticomyces elasticus]
MSTKIHVVAELTFSEDELRTWPADGRVCLSNQERPHRHCSPTKQPLENFTGSEERISRYCNACVYPLPRPEHIVYPRYCVIDDCKRRRETLPESLFRRRGRNWKTCNGCAERQRIARVRCRSERVKEGGGVVTDNAAFEDELSRATGAFSPLGGEAGLSLVEDTGVFRVYEAVLSSRENIRPPGATPPRAYLELGFFHHTDLQSYEEDC